MARRKNLRKRLTATLVHHGLHQVIGNHDPYYAVGMTATLDDEPGREVDLVFTADQAEWLGNSLIEYAEKVRQHNASLEAARKRHAAV